MEISNENLVDLQQYFDKYIPQIEKALRDSLPVAPPHIEDEFRRSIEAALSSNVERTLPIMTLLGAELFGANAEDVLSASVSLEYIFTASQTFRKISLFSGNGNLSETDEVILMLVAVGFLNASYPLVFVNHIGMPDRAMQAHREIIECIGSSGIVGDLAFLSLETKNLSREEVIVNGSAKDLRTSALIRLALRLGAILAGADYLDLADLSRVAEVFGEAFEVSRLNTENNDLTVNSAAQEANLNNLVDEAKRLLVENFPSNEARSCLIQLAESLAV